MLQPFQLVRYPPQHVRGRRPVGHRQASQKEAANTVDFCIRDDARLSEQEQGTSTLYVAFGYLESSEMVNSAYPNFAQSYVLPAQIDCGPKRHRYRYFIECGDGADPADNMSEAVNHRGNP